jgi:hypothetical protein
MATQLVSDGVESPGSACPQRIDQATREVAVQLGRALRREALSAGRIMALVEAGTGLPVPSSVTSSRHPFYVAVKAWADLPSPAVTDRPGCARRDRIRLHEAVIRDRGAPSLFT